MGKISIKLILDKKGKNNIDTDSNDIGIHVDSIEKAVSFINDITAQGNEKFINKLIKEKKNIQKETIEKIKDNDLGINKIIIKSGTSFTSDDITKIVKMLGNNITIDINDLDVDEINKIIVPSNIDDYTSFEVSLYESDSCYKYELDELLDYLVNIKNFVSRYNLSPLETCIFVYDLVRERKFKTNDIEEGVINKEKLDIVGILENRNNSRTLNKIYQSDNIVCAGFSALYKAILKLLNIDAYMMLYEPDEGHEEELRIQHVSNVVCLNDSKYNINGFYELDTTWDRISNGDNLYDYKLSIQTYFNFAKPLQTALKQKKAKGFIPKAPDFYDTGNGWFKEKLEGLNTKEIDLDTFEKALYRVRIVEHSIDKDKYQITERKLNNALRTRKIIEEEELRDVFCGQNENIHNLSEKEKLEIARAELISVLHKVNNDDMDKNPVLNKKKI